MDFQRSIQGQNCKHLFKSSPLLKIQSSKMSCNWPRPLSFHWLWLAASLCKHQKGFVLVLTHQHTVQCESLSLGKWFPCLHGKQSYLYNLSGEAVTKHRHVHGLQNIVWHVYMAILLQRLSSKQAYMLFFCIFFLCMEFFFFFLNGYWSRCMHSLCGYTAAERPVWGWQNYVTQASHTSRHRNRDWLFRISVQMWVGVRVSEMVL